LRRSSFTQAFDVNNRFYPLRFLELKGVDVPSAWAKEFASQFFLTDLVEAKSPQGFLYAEHQRLAPQIKDLYVQAIKYYDTHTTTPSRMSSVEMKPGTYVHYTEADVPAGTTVQESETESVIKQAGITVRLEKPLTKNFYSMNTLIRGEDVFLPLVTKERTFILSLRGSCLMPFELTCFDTQSGKRNCETVGWSGWKQKVEVLPEWHCVLRKTLRRKRNGGNINSI
jgi:hypothetical protein